MIRKEKQRKGSCQKQKFYKNYNNKQKLLNYQDYLRKLRNFAFDFQSNRKIKNELVFLKQYCQLNDIIQTQKKDKQLKNQSAKDQYQQSEKTYQKQATYQIYKQPQLSFCHYQKSVNQSKNESKNQDQPNLFTDFDSLLCLDEDIQSLMTYSCNKNIGIKNLQKSSNNLHFEEHTNRTSKYTELTMPSIQQRIISQQNQEKQKIITTHKKHRSMHNKNFQSQSFLQTLQQNNKNNFSHPIIKSFLDKKQTRTKKQIKQQNLAKSNVFNFQNICLDVQEICQNNSKIKIPRIQINVKQILKLTRKQNNLPKTTRQSNYQYKVKQHQNKKLRKI